MKRRLNERDRDFLRRVREGIGQLAWQALAKDFARDHGMTETEFDILLSEMKAAKLVATGAYQIVLTPRGLSTLAALELASGTRRLDR